MIALGLCALFILGGAIMAFCIFHASRDPMQDVHGDVAERPNLKNPFIHDGGNTL